MRVLIQQWRLSLHLSQVPCGADAAVLGPHYDVDSSSPQPGTIRAFTRQGRLPYLLTILTSRKVLENICF